MAYIIQQVVMGAVAVFAIVAGAFGAFEVVRLFLENLRGGEKEDGR